MAGRERVVSFRLTAKDEYTAQLRAAREATDKLRKAQDRTSQQRKTTDDTQKLRAEIERVSAAYDKAAAAAAELGREANIKLDSSAPTEVEEIQRAFLAAQGEARQLKAELVGLNASLSGLRGTAGGSFAAMSAGVTVLERQAAAARASTAALREQARAAKEAVFARRSNAGAAAEASPVGAIQADRQKFAAMQAEASKLRAEYDALRQRTGQLGAAIARATVPTEEMTNEFARARAELNRMRADMDRGSAAMNKFRATARGLNSGLAALGTGAVAGGAAGAAGGWWSNLVGGVVGSAATAHGRGPLGLRPYELQNLGYQINDLITQVASGTPVMQAFAQQGGQIAQIFPEATKALLMAAPAVAGIAAVVIPVIATFSRLRETEQILRDFAVQLEATADPSRYNPAALTAMVRELERLGIAADDSRSAMLSMMQEGLSPERMQTFLLAARDFAAVWGGSVPEALDRVRSGFDGTYESLKELDDQINFLTAAQRASIRETFEQGSAWEATEKALALFTEKMGAAAALESGPWSQAKRDLATAWRDMLDWMGTLGPIQLAQQAVAALAGVVAQLTAALNALDSKATTVAGRIARIGMQSVVDPVGGARSALQFGRDVWNGTPLGAEPPKQPEFIGPPLPTERDKKKAEDAAIEVRESLLEALEETGPLLDKANEDIRKRQEQAREKLLDTANSYGDLITRAEKGIADARQKAATESAEALARVDADVAESRFGAQIASLSEREQNIRRAVRDAELDLAKVGLTLDEDRRKSIVETTGALYDQEEAAKAANKAAKGGGAKEEAKERIGLERLLTALMDQRKSLMDQIEYQDESGESARADALRTQLEDVNGKVLDVIGNLRAFWATAGGGNDATAALLKLDMLEQELQTAGERAIVSGREINDMISDGAVDAMGEFAEQVTDGASAFEAAGIAFRKMAADFLTQIAEMILKQAILNALQANSSGGGGVGASIAGLIGRVLHSGGIAGSAGRTRLLPAALFANAPRYHNGTPGAGLGRNEVAAVLEKGEEVLRRDDPRHIANGGGEGGGTTLNTKIVNVLDSASVLQAALADAAGQRVIVNFLSANKRRVNAALG